MALLETESSLNAIFNAADDSIFLLSADETCIEVNEIGAKRLDVPVSKQLDAD